MGEPWAPSVAGTCCQGCMVVGTSPGGCCEAAAEAPYFLL